MNTSQCGTCGVAAPVLIGQWQRVHGRVVAWVLCRACFAADQARDAELAAERVEPKRRKSA